MEIIHTSDLHIVPEVFYDTVLEEAYYNVLREIVEKTIESKSKYLVISGDMFDRSNPPLSVVAKTVGLLRELREHEVRVVVVPGNHDVSRTRSSILHVLSEAGLIHLLDFNEANGLVLEPLVFEGDKLVFYGIPGFKGSSSQEIEYLKQRKVIFKNYSSYKDYNLIILAHISTRFAGYDPSKYANRYGSLYLEYEDLLNKLPSNTIYVALGHIHLPIPFDVEFKGNIAYPGAPIGFDFNDLYETYELNKINVFRRILRVDLSRQPPVVKSIKLEAVPRVYYKRIDAKSIDDVKEQVVRIFSDIDASTQAVLLVDAVGLDKPTSELENFRRELMKKKKVFIRIRTMSKAMVSFHDNLDAGSSISAGEISINEIESMVLREFVAKNKLKIPAEKLKIVIDTLGHSQDISPERLLDEIIKELGD
ncbi:MAG: DNA repair exonuclease [Desulfurococcaceae archaeon]